MKIVYEINQVKIEGQFTRVKVNLGTLILGQSDSKNTYSLIFHTDKDVVHLLCDNFKKLGNVNRYARCYGIEFIK